MSSCCNSLLAAKLISPYHDTTFYYIRTNKKKEEYCLAKFDIRADVCGVCHCHAMCGWLNDALSKKERKKPSPRKMSVTVPTIALLSKPSIWIPHLMSGQNRHLTRKLYDKAKDSFVIYQFQT